MEIKAELLYPYTQEEKESFVINQNHRLGYEIREVERTVEYEEKVFEFEEVEEERPIAFDEETSEPTEYETVIVTKPVMETIEEEIQIPIYGKKTIIDEETGEEIEIDIVDYETQIIEKEIQKFHYETREMVVIDLQAWGYTDEEIEEQKKEHIKQLTCTKRVFALMLQELGVDYITELKPLIESSPQAQLEWDLCVELLRANPMLDLMAGQLGITSEQLDILFEVANGIKPIEDLINTKETEKEDESEINV